MATLLEFAITLSSVNAPIVEESWSFIVLSAIFIQPFEVIISFSLIAFSCKAIPTINGLNIDPGSKRSVIGLFLTCELSWPLGYEAIANIFPVSVSRTIPDVDSAENCSYAFFNSASNVY